MEITKKIKKEIIEDKIVDILCNKCGLSCNHSPKGRDAEFYGLIEVQVHGGYESTHLNDMTSIKFSLCEKCISELSASFKIPATIKGELSSEYITNKEYEKRIKHANLENKKEWVSAIKETCKGLSQKIPKGLNKKNCNELYDLYHQIQASKVSE
jgi:hypothetical protein